VPFAAGVKGLVRFHSVGSFGLRCEGEFQARPKARAGVLGTRPRQGARAGARQAEHKAPPQPRPALARQCPTPANRRASRHYRKREGPEQTGRAAVRGWCGLDRFREEVEKKVEGWEGRGPDGRNGKCSTFRGFVIRQHGNSRIGERQLRSDLESAGRPAIIGGPQRPEKFGRAPQFSFGGRAMPQADFIRALASFQARHSAGKWNHSGWASLDAVPMVPAAVANRTAY